MLDRVSKECVCNAGYIGCDCLYDDTAENREKYPYSDHEKCREYNVMKEGIFKSAPIRNNHADTNEADILHDIIWNEIDVHFGEYHLLLLNVKMDLKSPNKYVKKSKTKSEEYNLDFIQIAKNIKLLIAIPLKIDIGKVWIENYKIMPNKLGKANVYNIDMSLSFTNQQKMSNKQLAYQMSKILHTLFGEQVKMETITDNNESGYDEVENAQIDYPDNEITFGEELEHNSNTHRYEPCHIINFLVLVILIVLAC